MIRLPLDGNYHENVRRTNAHWLHPRTNEMQTPCVVCGRGIIARYARTLIHVVGGGKLVIKDGERNPTGSDMGLLPIGPLCVLRYPELKPYLFK